MHRDPQDWLPVYKITNNFASAFNMYWSYVGYMRSLHISTKLCCGFGLVSGLDPVSIGFVDPDSDSKSWSGPRKGKNKKIWKNLSLIWNLSVMRYVKKSKRISIIDLKKIRIPAVKFFSSLNLCLIHEFTEKWKARTRIRLQYIRLP